MKCNDARWGRKEHKRTGYQVEGHWCNRVYANLFAEWKSYAPLGFDMQLATTPYKDVMCRSDNGTTCLPATTSASTNPIDPLVCGKIYRKRMGGTSTGYDDPKHWCSSPEFQRIEKPVGSSVGKENEFLEHLLVLSPWEAKDEPAWILRVQLPDPAKIDVEFAVRGKEYLGPAPAESRVAAVAIKNDEIVVVNNFASALGNNVQVDTEGRATLAIKMQGNGRFDFFQLPGWNWPLDVEQALISSAEVAEDHRRWGLPVSDSWLNSKPNSKIAIRTSKPKVADMKPGENPLAMHLVHELLVTKKRPAPGL
ncbi:hypothetical protein ABE85_15335 [Mitsuaria sp. 7]|nr:hypothetical protein ABE85_15335 [Mitsuaria sp. 7]